MAITSDSIVQQILDREAGLELNPADKGGITNYGVTLPTLQQVMPNATVNDLRSLSAVQAADIYRKLYVAPFEALAAGDDAFLALLADSAVQHGVSRVKGWIAAGATSYASLLARRIKYYGQIVVSDPTQLTFLNGWLNRVTVFVR